MCQEIALGRPELSLCVINGIGHYIEKFWEESSSGVT